MSRVRGSYQAENGKWKVKDLFSTLHVPLYTFTVFTGIIESTATVQQKSESNLIIDRPSIFDDIAIGSSIAVSGVCLSVAAFTSDSMTFDVVDETWQKSALGSLQQGDTVNVERALPANGRLDGHIVQGHIEGVGEYVSLQDNVLTVRLSPELIKLCVHKGSITLHGVSLTVASVTDDVITVALVPHTLENTNLGTLKTGDKINIETDILGRYLYAFTHEDR